MFTLVIYLCAVWEVEIENDSKEQRDGRKLEQRREVMDEKEEGDRGGGDQQER